MIVGKVNADDEPIIRVFILTQSGMPHELQATVDTGFNEFLSLPTDLIDALQLPFLAYENVILANGSEEQCAVHKVMVLWDGQPREARVQANEGAPLIGMSLMRGYRLTVDVEVDGAVILERITTP